MDTTAAEPVATAAAAVRPSAMAAHFAGSASPSTGSADLDIHAHRPAFPQLTPGGNVNGMPLTSLLDVTVTLTADLGRTTMTLGEVMKLGSGSVVALDRMLAEPVELSARGVVLARGEVVVVDDRFAIRIKEIVQPRQNPGGGQG